MEGLVALNISEWLKEKSQLNFIKHVLSLHILWCLQLLVQFNYTNPGSYWVPGTFYHPKLWKYLIFFSFFGLSRMLAKQKISSQFFVKSNHEKIPQSNKHTTSNHQFLLFSSLNKNIKSLIWKKKVLAFSHSTWCV